MSRSNKASGGCAIATASVQRIGNAAVTTGRSRHHWALAGWVRLPTLSGAILGEL